MKQIHSVDTKILLVYDCEYDKSAVCRAVQALSDTLADNDVMVIQSDYAQDAHALIVSDPSISCLLINYKEDEDEYPERIRTILTDLRTRNPKLPVFLMANRLAASNVPTDILDKVNDFIWILEDTTDFIAGRILNAAQNYQSYILPPMFKSLVNFANVHEYSWHTPGHTGGTAFLKSPAGRAFFDFFGERLFRSDLSISVGELGSLLDHSGPIGESELYMAKVFGAERSYHVTNGTSTSNRVTDTQSSGLV